MKSRRNLSIKIVCWAQTKLSMFTHDYSYFLAVTCRSVAQKDKTSPLLHREKKRKKKRKEKRQQFQLPLQHTQQKIRSGVNLFFNMPLKIRHVNLETDQTVVTRSDQSRRSKESSVRLPEILITKRYDIIIIYTVGHTTSQHQDLLRSFEVGT